MSYKLKFIVAALAAGIAATASANAPHHGKGPTVTLGGDLDTQFGYKSEKSPYNSVPAIISDGDVIRPAEKFDRYGIVNDTRLYVRADGHANCFKYGGLVVINADTSNSKFGYDPTDETPTGETLLGEPSVAYQTMMYVENCMGRIEAGSYTGAYDALKTGGASLAHATGGIDGDWQYWVNTNVSKSFSPLLQAGKQIVNPNLLTAQDHSYVANASKITYYTPTWYGFKAGVTYIPDTQQHGTVTNLRPLLHKFSASTFRPNPNQITSGFTDVFQGGFGYHGKWDKVAFRFSALGEIGEAKKVNLAAGTIADRKDLASWELGASAHYMCFGLAGSYGDLGKSGQLKNITSGGVTKTVANSKSGKYWTLGANYVHHHFGASFGYFNSRNGGFGVAPTFASPNYNTGKGKTTVYSFGIDYKLAPGFMPYAEYSNFSIKDGSISGVGHKNSGGVFLAGSKLHF